MDDFNDIEHPNPMCPACQSKKTRPLDENVAVCFNCDNTWFHEEDYSGHWEFNE